MTTAQYPQNRRVLGFIALDSFLNKVMSQINSGNTNSLIKVSKLYKMLFYTFIIKMFSILLYVCQL